MGMNQALKKLWSGGDRHEIVHILFNWSDWEGKLNTVEDGAESLVTHCPHVLDRYSIGGPPTKDVGRLRMKANAIQSLHLTRSVDPS